MKSMICILLLVSCQVFSQVKINENLLGLINKNSLRTYLSNLAGPAMQGRETATAGQKKAAAYLENQFRSLGLKPPDGKNYQQSFAVFRDSVIRADIRVNDISYKRDAEFGVFTDMNHACDMKFSEAVFAGYGISTDKYDNYKGLDVSGKLVIVMGGEPMINDSSYLISGKKSKSMWWYPPAKVQAATKLGAAAILIIQNEFPMQLYNYKQSSFWRSPYRFHHSINCFFISEKIAREIFREKTAYIFNDKNYDSLASLKPTQTQIALDYARKELSLQSTNVIGLLEGKKFKDQYVYITAHYDHLGIRGKEIFFGADDNGSGTAGLLEIAKAFAAAKKTGNHPDRSIVFIAFSGEENGLWGSDHYVTHPLLPLDKASAALNIDMLGRTDFDYQNKPDSANYVFVIGNDKLSSELLNIVDDNNKNVQLKNDYRFNDLNDRHYYYYRSDHYNFAAKGVPVLFFSDGEHVDYHKSTDTVDKINFDLLAKRVKLVFAVALDLASRKSMLKRDLPPVQ
jgi:hypothetical protein